jgi:hypothetical protein
MALRNRPTTIYLSEYQHAWLNKTAESLGETMAAMIRRAIDSLQKQLERPAPEPEAPPAEVDPTPPQVAEPDSEPAVVEPRSTPLAVAARPEPEPAHSPGRGPKHQPKPCTHCGKAYAEHPRGTLAPGCKRSDFQATAPEPVVELATLAAVAEPNQPTPEPRPRRFPAYVPPDFGDPPAAAAHTAPKWLGALGRR